MARRVFFSFHYERDVWRANVVRNSWVTQPDREDAGFIDASEFEEIKRQGEKAVKQWIDNQLKGTSVTVVLIGTETYLRDWVRYEIVKSFDRSNGQLGIYIHQIKDMNQNTDTKGKNPFEYLMLSIDNNGKSKYYEWDGDSWKLFDKYPNCFLNFDKKYRGKNYQFSKMYKLYDWKNDDGYNNLGDWIEEAAKQVGR